MPPRPEISIRRSERSAEKTPQELADIMIGMGRDPVTGARIESDRRIDRGRRTDELVQPRGDGPLPMEVMPGPAPEMSPE
jgi:hypothetical protein